MLSRRDVPVGAIVHFRHDGVEYVGPVNGEPVGGVMGSFELVPVWCRLAKMARPNTVYVRASNILRVHPR